MNYSSIYAAFITNRRSAETALELSGQYSESHHVIPRALGGGDDAANLIRLSPEDHFFAHLLLAKIHGGEMWAPVAFMVGGSRKDYKPTVSRKAHGWASRAMAKAKRGAGAHQFDHTVYCVIDADGRTRDVKQSEMPEALGLSKSLANMLIKDRVRVARGWSIVGRDRANRSGSQHHMHRKEVREFRHVDGEVFVGTQFEFSEAKNLRRPDVSRLVTGVFGSTKGWYLAERGLPESALARAKWQNHVQN